MSDHKASIYDTYWNFGNPCTMSYLKDGVEAEGEDGDELPEGSGGAAVAPGGHHVQVAVAVARNSLIGVGWRSREIFRVKDHIKITILISLKG